jgi:hypothetical protein
MAAIFAASADAETFLLERTPDGGRKILISGGGRCNILPARVEESRFVTDSSPHTLKRMLRSWPLAEQIAFFESELHLPLAEETASGKLFPVSNRARDVRDRLFAFAARRGVRLRFNSLISGRTPRGGSWLVEQEGAAPLEVDAVVLASGGLSLPKTGSDGVGLRILEGLGHTVHPLYAALKPLTAEPGPFAPERRAVRPSPAAARSNHSVCRPRDQPLARDDGALVRAPPDLAPRIERRNLEHEELALATDVARRRGDGRARRSRRRVRDVDSHTHRQLPRFEEREEHPRAGDLHQRDHPRGREDRRKRVAGVGAQGVGEIRRLDPQLGLSRRARLEFRHTRRSS